MLYKKLLHSLITIEIERKGSFAQDEWDEWLKINPQRREWNVGLRRARNESLWGEWSYKERKRYVLDLLSPFYVTEEMVEKFSNQI